MPLETVSTQDDVLTTESPNMVEAKHVRCLGTLGFDFRLTFDLDRYIERQLGHTDCASSMRTAFRAIQLKNEIREAVDYVGLSIETGRGVDHAKHSVPPADAIKVAQQTLERSEYR